MASIGADMDIVLLILFGISIISNMWLMQRLNFYIDLADKYSDIVDYTIKKLKEKRASEPCQQK